MFVNCGGRFAHGGDPSDQVLLQMRPFPLAGPDHLDQGLLQCFLDRRPKIFLFNDLFIGLKNARRAGQLIQRDRPRQLELFGQTTEFARIGLCQRDIEVHPRGKLALSGVQRDPRGEPAAGDVAVDEVADLGFEHLHLARQRHRNLALLAVDRAELDRDFETVLGAIPAAISGH